MKRDEKTELIAKIAELLMQLITTDETAPTISETKSDTLEMLTVKECAALVPGLSEHTVRQLVKRGDVAYIRCSAGKRGKILVSKDSLLKYLSTM